LQRNKLAPMKMRQDKQLSLALQGGGAHGAFTWGVLDRLLESQDLFLAALSGTSSGAVNAVVAAYGLACGGRAGARQALRDFWTELAVRIPHALRQPISLPAGGVRALDVVPGLKTYLDLSEHLSPYLLNPLNLNPLRDILDDQIDFERFAHPHPTKVYISATQVRTGKIRMFEGKSITRDAVLASACLPSLHHVIEIDGEHYWDGGFTGNPPVFPLIFDVKCSDILLVLVQALERRDTPKSAESIRNRTRELSFNSAFLREMRAIAFSREQVKNKLIPLGSLERKLARLMLHMIYDHDLLSELEYGSHFDTHARFIGELHDRGYACADVWMEENYRHLGKRPTLDLNNIFG
jgi:NTE family protein